MTSPQEQAFASGEIIPPPPSPRPNHLPIGGVSRTAQADGGEITPPPPPPRSNYLPMGGVTGIPQTDRARSVPPPPPPPPQLSRQSFIAQLAPPPPPPPNAVTACHRPSTTRTSTHVVAAHTICAAVAEADSATTSTGSERDGSPSPNPSEEPRRVGTTHAVWTLWSDHKPIAACSYCFLSI